MSKRASEGGGGTRRNAPRRNPTRQLARPNQTKERAPVPKRTPVPVKGGASERDDCVRADVRCWRGGGAAGSGTNHDHQTATALLQC